MKKVYEDGAPTNSAGAGGIAGLPPDSPPVSPRHQPKKNRSVPNPIIADMLRRKAMEESATLAALAAGSALGAAAAPHINKAVGKGLDWLEKKRKQKHQDHYEKKSRKNLKEETFAGAVVFEVSSHTFHNAKMEKRKGKHWRTYLDECDELSEIRDYANKNPKKAIVLQNRNTNEMVYVRYGGKAR